VARQRSELSRIEYRAMICGGFKPEMFVFVDETGFVSVVEIFKLAALSAYFSYYNVAGS
jgi:hypothetical protein